jgi:hypothetical protein
LAKGVLVAGDLPGAMADFGITDVAPKPGLFERPEELLACGLTLLLRWYKIAAVCQSFWFWH